MALDREATARARTPSAPADHAQGRLGARPMPPTQPRPAPGEHALGLGRKRDAFVYAPRSLPTDRPAPLAVLLHGAGGSGRAGLDLLRARADALGILLLGPDSQGQTWDVLLDDYGPDVALLDAALAWTFDRYAVAPDRLAIGGFSDGASYALSLGITNGDLFTDVIAFSPGFAAPAAQNGSPRIFVSHGTDDAVLRIDRSSRVIVPKLERAGYEVRYREFEGPHAVPESIAGEAVAWFLDRAG
jgi:phospholipase/carboxylesterase